MNAPSTLVPIRNFAEVRSGLYRSAQPEYRYEWRWLRDHTDVELVVSLRAEHAPDKVPSPLRAVRIPIKDHAAPTDEQAGLFLHYLDEGTPLLVHCEHGHGRTSTMVVLARLHEGWSLGEAINEERDRFGYQFRHLDELRFLQRWAARLKR